MAANYCYGCMRELPEGQAICPSCGHDNSVSVNQNMVLKEGTTLQNGKYLVGMAIGKGGFGVTYLGIDRKLNVRVAIKEFFPQGMCSRYPNTTNLIISTDAESRKYYERGKDAFVGEAQALAKFDSPGIVRVRDYFSENNTTYIIMNFVDGVGLNSEIKRCGGRMPWQRVIALMLPLMRDLDRMHQQKLIHRDIKPANIKITQDAYTGKERLVLLDFGAARNYVSSELTGTYTAILTPGYAPPEQYLQRTHQGPFTDIYSLCATMYLAISGEIPPASPDRMIGDAKLKRFSSFGLDVPNYIENAIFKGMEINYQSRPQNMYELYREFTSPEQNKPQKEQLYTSALRLMSSGTEEDLEKSQELFTQISGYRDADARLQDCREKISDLRLEETYQKAKRLMSEGSKDGYREAQDLFRRIPGWKDADSLAVDCEKKISGKRGVSWLIPVILLAAVVGAGIYFLMDRRIPAEPSTSQTEAAALSPADTPVPAPTKITLHVGSIITFGNYEQDGIEEDGAEPVEWQVLAAEDDRALVISHYILDSKRFHDDNSSIDWENCSLRKWLNNEFFNTAFSAEEKAGVLQVTNQNPGNEANGTEAGNATSDRIFLLSSGEARTYFMTDETRICAPTTYAKIKKGIYVNGGNSWWWLRTPGDRNASADWVKANGEISPIGKEFVNTLVGVRPAFWMDLSGIGSVPVTEEIKEIFPEPTAAGTSSPTETPEPAPTKISINVGDIITFGQYEQDNKENGAEPVEWQVLAVEDTRVLVISKYGLDSKKYHEENVSVTWERSSLRKWLNGEFFDDVFSIEEKGRILQVINQNPKNEQYGINGGNATNDRIFLLSNEEAGMYFPSDEARKCEVTVYAKSHGAYISSGASWWWLRSPGDKNTAAGWVKASGAVSSTGKDVANIMVSVRPAFWLERE